MENKEGIVDKMLCMSCLCVGRSLHMIGDGDLQQFYLSALSEIPLCNMPSICPKICWECKATLRRAVMFRKQAKDSYRILQAYTNENLNECLLSDVTRPPRIWLHHLASISITPEASVPQETPDPKEKSGNLEDVELIYVKEEKKNDGDRLDSNKSAPSDDEATDCSEITAIEIEIQGLIKSKKSRKRKKYADSNVKTRKMVDTLKMEDEEQELMPAEAPDVTLISNSSGTLDAVSAAPGKTQVPGYVKEELMIEWDRLGFSGSPRSPLSDAASEDDVASHCTETDAIQTKLQELVKKGRKKKCVDGKVRRVKNIGGRVKSGGKPSKRSKQPSKPKILTIEMTFEDMLQEREKEAQRESYTRSEFKCESCLVGFNYHKSYLAHVAAKHSPNLGDYSCPICKTIIASVESFMAHYKRHMRRYECSICHKRTMDVKVMQQHYYSTHEICLKEYKCNVCGKISNSIDTHRYHKDTHKARVQCGECDKTFSHRAGLMNHRLAVHEYRNDFPCTICDKVFRWRTSLKRHLDKHDAKARHAAGSAAFCTECGVTFSSVCSYQRHMKNSLKHVTQDQLKYICDHCNKRFADKTKLRDHIEEKHLHKTYQCHICLKPSKNRVGLDQHIRNVHKGRPNNKMCHHCGKGFPTKVQLESHIRSHTGERPFICEFCPTTFSQQSNLYKHNRQVHLNMKYKRYPMCKKRKEEKSEENVEVPVLGMGPYAHTGEASHARPVAVLHYSPERGFVM